MNQQPQLAQAGRSVGPRDRLILLGEVEIIVGFRKSHIYSLIKRGEFPRGVLVGTRCVRWSESAVHQWVQDRIAAAAATGNTAGEA